MPNIHLGPGQGSPKNIQLGDPSLDAAIATGSSVSGGTAIALLACLATTADTSTSGDSAVASMVCSASAIASPPTWVVQQTLKSGDESTASVNNALGKPGVFGFSQRTAINVLFPNGSTLNSSLIDSGKSVASSHSVAHCIRFMTGQWLPAQYYKDGGAYTTQNFFTFTLGTPTASFTNSATSFTLNAASQTTVIAGDTISIPTTGPVGTATITLSATCYAGDTTVSIVAGSWAGTVNAGATVTCNPAVPLPWDDTSASGRNEIFEGYFTTFVTGLAAWCRTNGDPILHISWYSGAFAELFLSSDITGYTGSFGPYTYTKFINGHKKLVDIADAVKGADLQVEAPMSGTGSLTNSGGNNTVGDLSAYIATKTNAATQWIVQLNGWDYGTYYSSPHDQPYTILAGQTAPTGYTNELNQENSALNAGVNHAFQARVNGDQDWQNDFTQASPASGSTPAINYWSADYVEIYPSAFNAGQAHLTSLLAYVLNGGRQSGGKATGNLAIVASAAATTTSSDQSIATGAWLALANALSLSGGTATAQPQVVSASGGMGDPYRSRRRLMEHAREQDRLAQVAEDHRRAALAAALATDLIDDVEYLLLLTNP